MDSILAARLRLSVRSCSAHSCLEQLAPGLRPMRQPCLLKIEKITLELKRKLFNFKINFNFTSDANICDRHLRADTCRYYSLFTLGMLVMFECTVVGSRIRNVKELRSLQTPKQGIQVSLYQ